MIRTRFASLLALPVLSAAIISGGAVSLAATAHADRGGDQSSTASSSDDDSATSTDGSATSTDDDTATSTDGSATSTDDESASPISISGGDGSYVRSSVFASPPVYASPAANLVPWAQWVNEGTNSQNMYGAVVGTDANP